MAAASPFPLQGAVSQPPECRDGYLFLLTLTINSDTHIVTNVLGK